MTSRTATKQTVSSQAAFGDTTPFGEPAWCNSITSPYYNETHRKLRDYYRKYFDTYVIPNQLDWEAKGDVPEAERRRLRDSGLGYRDIPLQYIPPQCRTIVGVPVDQMDVFHTLVATDESARVEGGVNVALQGGANVIGVPPIVYHGTEEQKRRWLPGLFTGETSFCLGITEPTGGSDVSNLRTTAVKTAATSSTPAYYTVNGYKKWITGAPFASHMTTAVRTGGKGFGGISLLVVPLRNNPGVSIRRIDNSGQHAGGASWVTLDNVKVPADHLLGDENAGFKYIMTNFNKERFIMAVSCNRKARTCVAHSIRYSADRETFGQPLSAHQILRAKLIGVARRIEGHWAWLEQLAWHVQQRGWQDPDVAGRIALAKVDGGRILEEAAREAQQVFGGAGYQRGGVGGVVEQISRDLRMSVVGGGSEEILGDLAWREEHKLARRIGAQL